jgi:hypothetical protein
LKLNKYKFRDSIVVSIPACHAGDRGSIPRLGVFFFLNKFTKILSKINVYLYNLAKKLDNSFKLKVNSMLEDKNSVKKNFELIFILF